MLFETENITEDYSVDIKNRFSQLEGMDKEPDEIWEAIKAASTQSAKSHLRRKKGK